MSTKTNFKRVALVAVASLGLGVLTSVAPAHASESLTVAANGATATTSRGIVNGTTASALTGLLNTMTVLTNGSLYITAGAATTTGIAVSGGTITSAATQDQGSGTVVIDSKSAKLTNNAAETTSFTVVPNAGATSLTVTQYSDNTNVTAVVKLTVTIAAVSTVGTFSPVYSNIKVQESADDNGSLTGTANSDDKYTSGGFHDATYGAVATTTRLNGVQGFLNFVLKDANDAAMSSSAVLTATATGGCLVGISTTTLIGTSATAMNTSNGDYIAVGQAKANTPYKCVVTAAINGVTFATRTFVLQGEVTKLVVSDQVIAKSADSTAEAFYVDAQDASGNSVPDVTIAPVSSTYNASVTGITLSGTTEVTAGTTGTVDCDAKGTNAGLKLYAQNASAALVYSDAFSMSCAGSPATYTASLDKASYSIGEVATLTISAKDSAGNLTYDGRELGNSTSTVTAATNAVSIAGGPMTQVGSIVSTDSFSSGVKKYKFTVGGIASGSFNLVVDLPRYNSTLYSQSAVTVPYKVTTTDSGVSNADVLKAIVSLIASINKQIAALQKALLKK